MVSVNFMVIGAVKAGTTSVYYYLKQHPEIYMSPIKETKFFLWDGETKRYSAPYDQHLYERGVKTFAEYQALFNQVNDETAIGEATPNYLYDCQAPTRIYQRLPIVKIIALLRQPADRSFSHYLHNKRLGFEPLNFSSALAQEEKRIQLNWGPNWHYKKQGFYYEQVKRFQDRFGQERVRVYLFDELMSDTVNTVRDMYAYLDVDPSFVPDIRIHNESALPKSKIVDALINQPNFAKALIKQLLPDVVRDRTMQFIKAQNKWKPQFDQKLRQELSACYLEDILKLENLIHKDLSHWRLD